MATLLTRANQLLRDGDHLQALRAYDAALEAHYAGLSPLPTSLERYCIDTLRALMTQLPLKAKDKNYVLTSCNAKYFSSLILLLQGIAQDKGVEIEQTIVFDFGLDPWQTQILDAIARVKVIRYDPEFGKQVPGLSRFDFKDPQTYFFKVYALHYGLTHIPDGNANLLWIDAGISIAGSLRAAFEHVDTEDAFFVDHIDTNTFYKDPQNLLVNILAPCLFTSKIEVPKVTEEQMLRPYIKANFFGLKRGGRFNGLLAEHLRICCETEVLFDPRTITDTKLKQHWLKSTGMLQTAQRMGIKNSCEYLYGRHEQAVWSYLVARENIPILDSSNYNYTVAPGTGSMKPAAYEQTMRSKILPKITEFRSGMEDFVGRHRQMTTAEATAPIAPIQLDDLALVDEYLTLSKTVFLDKPAYAAVGFPIPRRALRSDVLLHRGSLARTDQHKYSGSLLNHFQNIRDDIFILLGNGPSLGDVNFDSLRPFHTFGLNAAYRAYERINFWPKYFGCFDALVCDHHSSHFKALIRSSPIEKFFFINFNDQGQQIFTEPDIRNNPRFQKINFKYREPHEKMRTDMLSLSFDTFLDMRTSGSNTIQAALLMGYRKFILLGVDQNYVEVVEGAEKDKTYHKLVMKETPAQNPNYWFPDYQQKGDKFNRPNLVGSQMSAWNNLSITLDRLGIRAQVLNCSPISRLDCFDKVTLDEALARLSSVRVTEVGQFRSPLMSRRTEQQGS